MNEVVRLLLSEAAAGGWIMLYSNEKQPHDRRTVALSRRNRDKLRVEIAFATDCNGWHIQAFKY